MQRLSLLIILFFTASIIHAQSPHGENLNIDCVDCHTTDSWSFDFENSEFSHNNVDFILEGQHRNTDCKLCHTSLVFDEAKNTCISCHTDVHSMSTGNDCARCHDASNWLVDNVPELHERNGFPLLGQHRMAACVDCHKSENNLIWNRIGDECVSCHLENYESTTNPNHQESGFSTNCTDCHNPSSQIWSAENFHYYFPLVGKHDIQDCAQCHDVNNFNLATPECISCHRLDFEGVDSPNHIGFGFSEDCNQCHSGESWIPADFPHDNFPLVGRHDIQDCAQCHDVSNYSSASSECITCHLEDYNSVVVPNHVAGGFSEDCNQCHSGDSWLPANFSHNNFPLVGRHDIQDCAECHDVTNYSSVSSECISCHLDDYNSVVVPNHVAGGFSEDCNQCHSGNSWLPANFPHNNFPLVGKHDIQDCAACHDVTNYSSVSSECISCHLDDYNSVVSPNHVASGFSENCNQCHAGNTWLPASFIQHDSQYFPIYSGKHNNEWSYCNECHIGNDLSTFSCIICHNDQVDLANEHNGESDYVYESNACYDCHPTGEAED